VIDSKMAHPRPSTFASIETVRDANVARLKYAAEAGLTVIGTYCTYCPKELILAVGALQVGLCGTRERPIAAAEQDLPRNLCPLVKSSYGFAVSDTCPFFRASDMVIGETTCDGKKKMFELIKAKGLKEIYVMHLPQVPDTAASLDLWTKELFRLKEFLEERYQIPITDEKLRNAIRTTNEQDRVRKRLFDLNQRCPAVVSGLDLLTVSWQMGFQLDPLESIRLIRELGDELEASAADGYSVGSRNTKRVLLTGTPVGIGSEKVVRLVEESGALVVAMENCSGYKAVDRQIDESDMSDPLVLLARKYMQIPCSVWTPNKGRFDLLRRMARDFKVGGVIDLDWQACHTYNIESYFVSDLVRKELNLPFLQLETDYSESDIETLRVRIEAFLETV